MAKPKPFAAARLRQDERIDAHYAAIHVHQRAAAVAGIDGRIRLYVGRRIVFAHLPRRGAHHAHGDGVLQPLRAAEGKHHLSLLEFVGVRQLQRRQIGCRRSSVPPGRIAGRFPRSSRSPDHAASTHPFPAPPAPASRTRILRAPCTTCALVTMYPSADRITPAPMASCGSNSAVSVDCFSGAESVAGRDDLHHRLGHLRGQRLDRLAEHVQGIAAPCTGRRWLPELASPSARTSPPGAIHKHG